MTNSAMSQRLKEAMEYTGIKPSQLSRLVGVAPASVTNWRNGNTSISARHMEAICKVMPDISYSWLATGGGQMIKRPVSLEYCKECISKDAKIEMLTAQVRRLEDKLDSVHKQIGGLQYGK